jgi:ketosteroid isomerase-like protein
MPKHVLHVLPCALIAIALSCASVKPTFRTTDRAAITSLLDEQRKAWNRGDIPAFMEGYVHTSELVFTSGAKVRRGWQETHDRYLERYGTDTSTMGTLGFEVIDLKSLGADGAVMLGRWSLAGLEEPAGGVFTIVFERRPEGWRIVHDHTSSDAKS